MRARLLVTLLLSACATPPPARTTWSDAFAHLPGTPGVDDTRADVALADALAGFATSSEALRTQGARGTPMPPALTNAWSRALDATQAVLARPPLERSPLDLVRARLTLQEAWAQDAGRWSSCPLTSRIQLTLAQLGQVLAVQQLSPRVSPRTFLWPVAPVVVTSPYGDRVHPLSSERQFHAGVDLGAEAAQPVYAAERGVVAFAGWKGGYGNAIDLQHDAHLATRYAHLQTALVRPGALVKRGDLLGLAGRTGDATGVHLHFELREDGTPLDPEALLPPPPAALAVATKELK